MAPTELEDEHEPQLHRWCSSQASRSADSRAVEPGHARLTSGGGLEQASRLGREPKRGFAAVSKERVAAGLLGVLGVLTLGTGLDFLLVRPAMLPEDLRFTGVNLAELSARMSNWLGIVFRTGGGFMVGFGIVLIGVAVYLFTARRRRLYWATAISVVVAFGRFLLSNIEHHSDHLVFIAISSALRWSQPSK